MVTINYFDYLSQELTEGIFCRLHLRGLIRLKSVSRSWLNLIDHLRLIGFVHTSSGLVVFLPIETFAYPNLHQVTLLTVKDHGNECAPDSSLIIHNIPWLIDSCNGLLLFAGEDDSSMRYHICSPITKKWVSLPLAHDFSRTASASLGFDGSNLNPNRNFIVMCIFWEESCACENETANIKYLIFSSKTWEWIEDGSSLMLDSKFNPNEWFRPCLYRKRKLHWIWSLCLLVYDDKTGAFSSELPRCNSCKDRSLYSGRFLWESEGRLHYCDSTYAGFYIWDSLEDDEAMDYKLGSPSGLLGYTK